MELTIPSLTANFIGLNAIVCFLVIIVVWAYLFGRVKFSQALLGAFCCVVLMLIENLIDSVALAEGSSILRSPILHAAYMAAFVVLLRTTAQFAVMRTVLMPRFSDANAALGFAIGFASLELIVGGISNVTTYTLSPPATARGWTRFWPLPPTRRRLPRWRPCSAALPAPTVGIRPFPASTAFST